LHAKIQVSCMLIYKSSCMLKDK